MQRYTVRCWARDASSRGTQTSERVSGMKEWERRKLLRLSGPRGPEKEREGRKKERKKEIERERKKEENKNKRMRKSKKVKKEVKEKEKEGVQEVEPVDWEPEGC